MPRLQNHHQKPFKSASNMRKFCGDGATTAINDRIQDDLRYGHTRGKDLDTINDLAERWFYENWEEEDKGTWT